MKRTKKYFSWFLEAPLVGKWTASLKNPFLIRSQNCIAFWISNLYFKSWTDSFTHIKKNSINSSWNCRRVDFRKYFNPFVEVSHLYCKQSSELNCNTYPAGNFENFHKVFYNQEICLKDTYVCSSFNAISNIHSFRFY